MYQTIFTKLEQFLRTLCFLFFLSAAITTILIADLLKPLYPLIDKFVDKFITGDFKANAITEYIHKFIDLGMFKLFGIDYIVENRTTQPIEKSDSCVVMFTHGSNLDPPLLHLLFPNYLHFVAKNSLFKIPFLGKALTLLGQIPIARDNLESAIKSLETAGRLVAVEKKSVAISPEGTRRRKASTGPDQLLPFKKGAFHLAKKAHADIVPIVIIGANRLWPSGQIYPSPGTLVVRFCERIHKDNVEKMSIEQLQKTVQATFQENLTPVDNRVIFNTDNKPYLMFMATLVGVATTWAGLARFFLY